MQRYQRQIQVDKISHKGQQSISNSKVVIVGAGGLGSIVGQYLAGAGVGEMVIVDHDVVSLSNLHRQTLYREKDIGQPKTQTLQLALSQLNSEIQITAIAQALEPDNIDAVINSAEVIVDAADNFVVSYLLSDYCFSHRIPLVSASVVSTQGHVGVFCGTQSHPAPSIRAVLPHPPVNSQSCSQTGVTGSSVGIIGSLQAQEVLKVLLNDPASLLGKLLYFDLWQYRQTLIDFSQTQEPENNIEIISESQINPLDIVVDVRSQQEVADQAFELATHSIPLDELANQAQYLPRKQRIVCLCQSGNRALTAGQQLDKLGFTQTAVLYLF